AHHVPLASFRCRRLRLLAQSARGTHLPGWGDAPPGQYDPGGRRRVQQHPGHCRPALPGRSLCGGGAAAAVGAPRPCRRHPALRHRGEHRAHHLDRRRRVLDRALDASHDLSHVQRDGELPLHLHDAHDAGLGAGSLDGAKGRMKRPTLYSLVALALMAIAGVLITVPAGGADVPLRSSFEAIPDVLPGWAFSSQTPGDALPPDAGAPSRLFRGFERGGRPLWVSVEYFPSQDEARRSAARTLIIPGHGWSQIAEQPVRLTADAAPGGGLNANLVLMDGRVGKVAVVYWYQIGQTSLASDHWYRAQLLYN